MKVYEGMILVNAQLNSEGAVEHVNALLGKHDCELIRAEVYAEQKLAYEINKQKRGIYVLAAFRQAPEGVNALNRDMNLDENVLRYLILDRSGLTVEKFFKRYDAATEDAPRERAGV